MFDHMRGRQLAGWGYGIFWFGLLLETVDAFVSAHSTAPLSSPFFWAGQIMTLLMVATAIRMMVLIQRRPW